MKNLEIEIKDILTSRIDTNDFNREHIFYAILNSIDKDLEIEEKMELFYSFLYIQKSFRSLIFKDNSLYSYYINRSEIENIKINNKLAIDGIKAIYFPVIAFENYQNKEYDLAEVNIKKSIQLLDKLILNGCSECINAKLEQNLNLIRIYLFKNNYSKAIEIGIEIINYLITFKKTATYNNVLFKDFVTDKIERNSIFNYYMDSIYICFIKHTKKFHIQDLIDRIKELKFDEFEESQKIIHLIDHSFNSNLTIDEIDSFLKIDLNKISFILQFLFLENIDETKMFDIEKSYYKQYYNNFQSFQNIKKTNIKF